MGPSRGGPGLGLKVEALPHVSFPNERQPLSCPYSAHPGVSCAEQGFVTIVYLLWHLCLLAMSESSLSSTNRPFANSC